MKKVGKAHIKGLYRKTILIPFRKEVGHRTSNPSWTTLVCTDNGKIVGTSSFCESRLEQFQGWGEIISIYLLPNYIGKGYGKILMEATLSELKTQGYENVFLWVLEDNMRAKGFYEYYGFLPTDNFLENPIGGKSLREVRYVYKNK